MNIDIIIKRNKRNKSIRITIKEGGNVLVTYPWWSNRRQVEAFIKQKQDWIEASVAKMRARKTCGLLKEGPRQDYLENKEKARQLVEQKLKQFNIYFNCNLNCNKISIRNQKTRWGSCSGKRNLNFNWRIVLLPENLQNYLVVHEMCHLEQMNHSKKFWELVEKAIPNYQIISKQLRKL
jgi:predicted metal-dependent hydrolase